MAKFTFHNSGQFSYFTLRAVPRETDGFYPTSSNQITFISGAGFSDVTSSIKNETFGSPFVEGDFHWSVALPPGTSSFIWPSGSTENATTVPASASQIESTGEGTVTIGETTFNLQDLTSFTFAPELVPGDGGGGGGGLATASNAFSMTFSGVDDFINLGTDSVLDIFGGDFSISLWFSRPSSPANGSARAMVEMGGFSDKAAMSLGFTSNTGVGFAVGSNWYTNAGSGYNDGNFHHMVGTRTGTTYKIYIDGEEVEADAPSGTYSYLHSTNTIGKGSFGGNFEGALDEIAFFTSSLDASTVESIYSASLPLGSNVTADLSALSTPPVAWYRMGD